MVGVVGVEVDRSESIILGVCGGIGVWGFGNDTVFNEFFAKWQFGRMGTTIGDYRTNACTNVGDSIWGMGDGGRTVGDSACWTSPFVV